MPPTRAGRHGLKCVRLASVHEEIVFVTLTRPDIQTSTGSFSGVKFDESLGDVCAHSGRSTAAAPHGGEKQNGRKPGGLAALPHPQPTTHSALNAPPSVHSRGKSTGRTGRSSMFQAVPALLLCPHRAVSLPCGERCRSETGAPWPYGGSARKSPRVHQLAVTSWPPGAPPGP